MNPFPENFDHQKYSEIQAGCLLATQKSMDTWCQIFGLPVEDIMAEIKRGRHLMILSTAQIKAGDNYQKFVDAYYENIRGMDFWEITDYHYRSHVSDAYEALEVIFDEPLIEQGYIIYLGKKLGMDPTQYLNFYSFVSEFSRYVPHIYLYEFEFNAFVTRKSEVNGFPAVVFYQTLYGVMQNMATIIVRNFYEYVEIEGKFYVRENQLDQIREAGESVFVTLALGVNLQVLAGRNFFSGIDLTPKPGVEDLVNVVIDLVNKYVTLHEYGHLYRGHLFANRLARELEFDADYFAIAALSRFAEKNQINSNVYNLAVTITFFTMHVREVMIGIRDANYPSALERFNYVLSLVDNRDKNNTPAIFWEKMRLLTSPTLMQQFGLEI